MVTSWRISTATSPDLGFIPSPFVFPPTEIMAGGSHAFSAIIRVEIGQKTTINWTADCLCAF